MSYSFEGITHDLKIMNRNLILARDKESFNFASMLICSSSYFLKGKVVKRIKHEVVENQDIRETITVHFNIQFYSYSFQIFRISFYFRNAIRCPQDKEKIHGRKQKKVSLLLFILSTVELCAKSCHSIFRCNLCISDLFV